MAGSSIGKIFTVTTWGESHGPALGAVVEGCPAGLPLSPEDFTPFMERRRPNGGRFSTKRVEADLVEILSGVYEGVTTGAPILLLIRSTDQHSSDYDEIARLYRPGHADYTFDAKYGIRDPRGGGRSSARETAARVAAGAIAAKILRALGISFDTQVAAIGGISASDPEKQAACVDAARKEGDSVGSEVICRISGVPAGIGDPVFDKLDARLAQAVFSIGAVKALDIGAGREASQMRGSDHNDPLRMADGKVTKTSNHAGGILGGISDGSPILLHVYFKPTPSISKPQETVTKDGENVDLSIRGRHDPVIAPRAAVVVEAMCALTLLDAMLVNMSAKMTSVIDFYRS